MTNAQGPTSSPSQNLKTQPFTYPPIPSPGICYPTTEAKSSDQENDWIKERSYSKTFSKSRIQDKIEEYKSGKYTEKYILTFLDFMHLEGIIDNLTFLEFKKQLSDIS